MSWSDYPSDWEQRRKEVYERDRFTCQNCGRRGGPHGDHELHAHHIVPKASGGSDDLSNLKTLCRECHNAVHTDAHAPTVKAYEATMERTSETATTLVRRLTALSVALVVYFIAAYVWLYVFNLIGLGQAGEILGVILALSPAYYTKKHLG